MSEQEAKSEREAKEGAYLAMVACFSDIGLTTAEMELVACLSGPIRGLIEKAAADVGVRRIHVAMGSGVMLTHMIAAALKHCDEVDRQRATLN